MTSFSEIYTRAIFRFADYDFLQKDASAREDVLEHWLDTARVDFDPKCSYNLTDVDKTNKRFNFDLPEEEQEILGMGVACHWLRYKISDSRLLKNVLNSKDYYYYSPANLLKSCNELYNTLREEYDAAMNTYSFAHSELDIRKPR